MFDDVLEFKVGDLVTIDLEKYGEFNYNIWSVKKHLIGGYICENLVTGDEIWPNYFDVYKWEIDLKKVPYHEGHEVVSTFVSNPKYDSYYYCRDCKEEVDPVDLLNKKAHEWANDYKSLPPIPEEDDWDDFGFIDLDD